MNKIDESNFILFAAQSYDNPQCMDETEFFDDLKRFKYLKRLLKRYVKTGVLRTNLILNHLIVLFNVFGEGTLPLLMYKLEHEYWSVLKTFVIYLNRYEPTDGGTLDTVEIDDVVKTELDQL